MLSIFFYFTMSRDLLYSYSTVAQGHLLSLLSSFYTVSIVSLVEPLHNILFAMYKTFAQTK